METPDEEREITNLTLISFAQMQSSRKLTLWQTAQYHNWLNPEAFQAKFEPFKEQYEKLLIDYKKRAIS